MVSTLLFIKSVGKTHSSATKDVDGEMLWNIVQLQPLICSQEEFGNVKNVACMPVFPVCSLVKQRRWPLLEPCRHCI